MHQNNTLLKINDPKEIQKISERSCAISKRWNFIQSSMLLILSGTSWFEFGGSILFPPNGLYL